MSGALLSTVTVFRNTLLLKRVIDDNKFERSEELLTGGLDIIFADCVVVEVSDGARGGANDGALVALSDGAVGTPKAGAAGTLNEGAVGMLIEGAAGTFGGGAIDGASNTPEDGELGTDEEVIGGAAGPDNEITGGAVGKLTAGLYLQ